MADEYKKHSPGNEPPVFTLLSDHPIHFSEDEGDFLDLHERLRVHFDTIRHRNTQTPFTMALYGDWGTGKTSAMRWIEKQLGIWNGNPRRTEEKHPHPHLTTVWFYPWKYHTREDVWRGIIAEVILASLEVGSRDGGLPFAQRVSAAGKQFGKFLGHSFLHALSNVKFRAGTKESGAELSGRVFQDIFDEYNQTARPHAPLLNDFESQLTQWMEQSFDDSKHRLVLLIDDLDRCLPTVALEVLEALKLYLNLKGLMVVVGVDRGVIDQIVAEHYRKNGVGEEKSRKYLAKLFQVELDVQPSDVKAKDFLERKIRDLNQMTEGIWNSCLTPSLDVDIHTEKFKGAIEETIRLLGSGNPREFTRLLNSLLVKAGAAHAATDNGGPKALRFLQGAQAFLIDRLLEDFTGETQLLHHDRYRALISLLSEIRRTHEDTPYHRELDPSTRKAAEGFSRYLRSKDDFREAVSEETATLEQVSSEFREVATMGASLGPIGSSILRTLVEMAWDLLLIPFSPHIAAATTTSLPSSDTPTTSKKALVSASAILPESVIAAVARELKIPIQKLTPEIFLSVTELKLTGEQITSLTWISAFPNIKVIDLTGTRLRDLSPLKKAPTIHELNLSGTPVKDISPLRHLPNLQWLYLSETQIRDVSILQNFASLRCLDISNTRIKDVSPLRSLSNLRFLAFSDTEVDDISPLLDLSALQHLFLSGTQVKDLTPLQYLPGIQSLFISHLSINDFSVLRHLPSLEDLFLYGTPIEDLSSLQNLPIIKELNLSNTAVVDISPLRHLSTLRSLDLSDTQVSNLSPLLRLSALKKLDLSSTPAAGNASKIARIKAALPNATIITSSEEHLPD